MLWANLNAKKEATRVIDKNALLSADYYDQPYQKEKDYIEELFLTEIYAVLGDRLAFKGGTALAKFYGSARFSDDLDFSDSERAPEDGRVAAGLDTIVDEVSDSYPTKTMRRMVKEDMMTYELSIRGPLFEMLNKYQHLKIEIDKKASLLEKANIFRRNPKYEDLKPYLAVVMSEKEILAEKVVALMFRRNAKARDLYDIYFLVKKDTEIKVSLVDRKMREHGHAFSNVRMLERIGLMGKIWNAELYRLLPRKGFVAYKEAKRTVIERFESAGLL